jgi:hypothetical protein
MSTIRCYEAVAGGARRNWVCGSLLDLPALFRTRIPVRARIRKSPFEWVRMIPLNLWRGCSREAWIYIRPVPVVCRQSVGGNGWSACRRCVTAPGHPCVGKCMRKTPAIEGITHTVYRTVRKGHRREGHIVEGEKQPRCVCDTTNFT